MRTLLTSALGFTALAIASATAFAAGGDGESPSATVVEGNRQQPAQSDAASEQPAAQAGEQPMASAEGPFIHRQKDRQALSGSLIGASVYIGSGDSRERIGEISGLIFNRSGGIEGAVVDVGGFLGIGERSIGIKWASLTKEEQEDSVAFAASLQRSELENAPEYRTHETRRNEVEYKQEGSGSSTD